VCANVCTGLVRAPFFTTLVQVASRFWLVWAICYPFPHLQASPVFASMLFAWGAAETIRYTYFFVTLCGAELAPLTWLRYSAFTVLYPVGISSECWLIWRAVGPSASIHPTLAPLVLYASLAIYVPGTFVLYGHMLKQRRKMMAKQRAAAAATTDGGAELQKTK